MIWWLGADLSWKYVTPFGVVVTVVSVIVALFNRVLWGWWPFSLFSGTPDLRGDWDIELKSVYIDPATKLPKEPITGTAVIRQTFATLSIRTTTDSQTSFLIAHNIIRHSDEVYEITGVYQSDPDLDLRGDQSEIHYGAFRYSVNGPPVTEMKGQYWTDRHTRGKVKLTKRKSA
jgi:hypothetical protein